MDISWTYHGYTMDMSWIYHGISWIYHGYNMDRLWIYHRYVIHRSSIYHRYIIGISYHRFKRWSVHLMHGSTLVNIYCYTFFGGSTYFYWGFSWRLNWYSVRLLHHTAISMSPAKDIRTYEKSVCVCVCVYIYIYNCFMWLKD